MHSTTFENETIERGLSTTQIKDFVNDKFSNADHILSQMGISTASEDKPTLNEDKPTSHTRQGQESEDKINMETEPVNQHQFHNTTN